MSTISYDITRRFGLTSIRLELTSNPGAGTYHFLYPKDYEAASGAGLKLDLTGFHEVQFYMRTSLNTTNFTDWEFRMWTDSFSYYVVDLDMATKYWHKEDHYLADFTAVSSPDLTNINALSITFDSNATGGTGKIWIDGLRLIRHQILGDAEDTDSIQKYGARPLYLVDKGYQFMGYPQLLADAVLEELKDEQVEVTQTGPINVEIVPGYLLRTWDGTDFDNLRLRQVEYDFNKNRMSLALGKKSADLEHVLKAYGYEISQIAQMGGDVSGVTPAEEPVIGCGTTCEITCQAGCMAGCQTECELACQTACEIACQTGCEVSCETGCQVTCEYCWESGPVDL